MSLLQLCQSRLSGVLHRLAPRTATQVSDDFDRLPLALVRLDEQGRMTRLSTGWETLTGYRSGDCLAQAHAGFIHIEDRARWLQALEQLRQGQADWVAVLRYLTRSGELRWAEVRLCRQARGFLASLTDVSAQIPPRERLQAQHRSLSNLVDGLPLMVYRCRNTRDWTMEYVSAGSLALTGYSPERLVDSHSLTYDSLIHPEDREQVWRQIQQGLAECRPFIVDYRLVGADGRVKAVHERGCGIYSDAGEVLGLEGVVMEQY